MAFDNETRGKLQRFVTDIRGLLKEILSEEGYDVEIAADKTMKFTATLVTIAFSVIPANDEPHKGLAVAKIVGLTALLLAVGVFAFAWGKSHAAKNPA